jgi:hypothetical protein
MWVDRNDGHIGIIGFDDSLEVVYSQVGKNWIKQNERDLFCFCYLQGFGATARFQKIPLTRLKPRNEVPTQVLI